MQSYKLSVSKNGKKYTIVFKAETEKLARERVHKEGYSILSIEEINIKENLGNIFLFRVKTKTGEIKKGKIVGDDIFKVFVKLKKDLEYDIITLFNEKDITLSEEEKNKIVQNLKEEYELLFMGKKQTKKEKLKEEISKNREEKHNKDNFYLKKELEETYKLIDFVLEKLQKHLEGKSSISLNQEQIEKIKIVYNSIIKIKKTTNISKLKQIGELALIKIGRIELEEVENKQEDSSKKLLKETNLLLKKIGSKTSFTEKNKDIGYQINLFFSRIKEMFGSIKKNKDKQEVDKYAHSYMKNILFLKKYQEKLKENNNFVLKNFFSLLLNKEKRDENNIYRKVLKQNITLFKTKEKGISFSYTFVKKGFGGLIEFLLSFLKNIRNYLFIVIILYIITFIIYLNINFYYNIGDFNYKGLFYFIVIFFIYLVLYFTRNIFLVFLNFVILFFIIIFGVVNF